MAIIDEILEKLPSDAMIANHSYEGANIVLYTKNKKFFKHGGDSIRALVDEFKKRIDLRADSSIRMDVETAEKEVKKILPKNAEVEDIILEPARALITIEAKNPGKAIGKSGSNLKKIKEKTFWTPIIKRESILSSKITKSIRSVLYKDSTERRKFLHAVGERIYETKKSSTEEKWVRISCLGGSRQVGRSCFLLQTPESKILIDCGVNVASDRYSYPYIAAPEVDLQDIDAVIISHAHLDHSGFLPYLFKYGYEGPVYCTAPTRDTMALLQLDYIDVSYGQAKKSIYSSQDIKNVVKNTITLDYGEVTDITPDVRITLHDAGHILGSSVVHLHVGEGWHNILYTGDFKTKRTKLLNPAHHEFPRVETLITESTYGGSEDEMKPREESEEELCEIIKKTIKRKGKVLVPVLGVGRAQEVMVILEDYFNKEKLKTPIYIDGMVWDVTAICNAYPEFLNKDIREKIFYSKDDPFLSKTFKRVGSKKERDKVIDGKPCVILATSGMLVGGPSVEYLKKLAGNKKNSIVFVSYQGEGSLGNKIQKGETRLNMEGEKNEVELNMQVHVIPGLSGHSDINELVGYVDKMKPQPRKVIVVHGENSKCLNLASTCHKRFKIETTAPRNLDALRLR
jgi:KH/beta-lactamase-domain protein